MERRTKRKTQVFFNRISDSQKTAKGEWLKDRDLFSWFQWLWSSSHSLWRIELGVNWCSPDRVCKEKVCVAFDDYYLRVTWCPPLTDQKTTVSKDLEEMGQKIRFLQLCRTHIEMLQTELDSINPTFLVSLSAGVGDAPLRLKPQCDNPLLQFQTYREPQTGCEIQMVQAGAVEGLVSYLFAS